ncbi:hypothetical protein RB595_003432 [Gaeumannomyces hyphopodioides]
MSKPLSSPFRLISAIILLHYASASSPSPVVQREVQVVTVTAAPTIPSDAPEYVSRDRFTSAVLNSTNAYRRDHDAANVTWNDTLARFADDYLTKEVTDKCEFEHSGGPYGENLAIGYPSARSAVEAWGDERERYDFQKADFSEETGHFTQLVWRNTSDVGCGRRLCGTKGWYLVCEYWPRGNVIGEFKDMVAGPVEGASWRGGAVAPTSAPMTFRGLTVIPNFSDSFLFVRFICSTIQV